MYIDLSLGRKKNSGLFKLIIAIDGPAASGKSTTAKLAASRLGFLHLDTGAMYRAVTLKVLHAGIALDDEPSIGRLMQSTEVELRCQGDTTRVLLDGVDVTREIRSAEVTRAVSAVSSLRPVRAAMVREQRRMGEKDDIVAEGRDIGTVVFPEADLKFYMVAGIDARARRREAELREKGLPADFESLKQTIAERDHKDSTRTVSPLRKAEDAVEIDTSGLTIEQQVELVVREARKRMRGKEGQ